MSSAGPPSRPDGRLAARARRMVDTAWFPHGVTAAIVTNAVVIGLDTSVALSARFGGAFALASQTFLAVFVIEALIKMAAVWPRLRDYFADGWNLFDFTVIAVSLLPATGELATLARLARLFRVLRLVSVLPELRLIVATLIRSVPGMFNVLALMSIVFYVYGAWPATTCSATSTRRTGAPSASPSCRSSASSPWRTGPTSCTRPSTTTGGRGRTS